MKGRKHHWKPRSRWIQEGFEKAAVHALQHAIVEDTWFEFRNGFGFEEIQMFGRHDGWGQVSSVCFSDLKAGLCEEDCFGTNRLADAGASNPSD